MHKYDKTLGLIDYRMGMESSILNVKKILDEELKSWRREPRNKTTELSSPEKKYNCAVQNESAKLDRNLPFDGYSYYDALMPPSKYARLFNCVECDKASQGLYRCVRCSAKYCSLRCRDLHEETSCTNLKL